MNAYSWDATYDRAVSLYHGPAHPDTERQILEHFEDNPKRVIDTIEDVGAALKRGDIRSGWGILVKRLTDAKARERLIVRDTTGRDTALHNAETWIINAGHYLTWTEVIAELFGPTEYTPSAEFLLQLELDTRDRPGRPLYDDLLKACIARTLREGPQPIPDSGGRIRQHDSPQARERLHAVWSAAQAKHDESPSESAEAA